MEGGGKYEWRCLRAEDLQRGDGLSESLVARVVELCAPHHLEPYRHNLTVSNLTAIARATRVDPPTDVAAVSTPSPIG